MCGRYVRKTGAQEIAQAFSAIDGGKHLALNFNISPTSDVFVLRANDGVLRLDVMSWGLVPVWAKDVSRAASLINARSESVAEKPSFRNLISRHRCVMPMNAYYEWKPMKAAGKAMKQPFAFFLARILATTMSRILRLLLCGQRGEMVMVKNSTHVLL